MNAEFEKRGYVVVRNVLDAETVAACVEAIDALRPQFKKKTWTIPDGVTREPALWSVITHPGVLAAVEDVLGPGFKFLQHNDIHFGFSSFAWHRDSVNRKFGDLPDWKEDDQSYRAVRVGFYFQPPEGGFQLGMIPGSHRPAVHFDEDRIRRVEKRISDLANLTAKATGTDRFADDADWITPRPGDAVIFDPRTIHTGSDFEGEKYSVFVAYGYDNRHFQEHYQYYRYLRKDLKYRSLAPELVDQLKSAGLYAGEGQTIERIEGAWIPSEVFRVVSGFFK